jgi:hypothetical protein
MAMNKVKAFFLVATLKGIGEVCVKRGRLLVAKAEERWFG